VVLTPPDREGFRVFSERSIVGEWKDGTQQFFSWAFTREWRRRMDALQVGKTAFEALPPEQLAEIGRRFGAGATGLPRRPRVAFRAALRERRVRGLPAAVSVAHARLAPALAVGAFLVLALTSAASHSGTFDEGVYVSAGYAGWRFGDFRVNTTHPPLAKLLAAAPLLLPGRARRPPGRRVPRGALVEAGAALRLRVERAAATPLLGPRRRGAPGSQPGAVGVGMGAAALGSAAGSLALLLAALSPDLLAHGSLATTDLPVTALAFASVVAFERLLEEAERVASAGDGRRARRRPAEQAHGAVAAAAAVRAGRGRRPGARPAPPAIAATHAGVARALRRDRVRRALGRLWLSLRGRRGSRAHGAARWRAGGAWLRDSRLLPEAYVHGLFDLFARSQDRRAFLLGQHSSEGWWYYFPVTFLLKTPLPLLALLAVALLRAPASWRAAPPSCGCPRQPSGSRRSRAASTSGTAICCRCIRS
jgi:hypothetical protein